jgi:hypothetical protein
VHATKTVIITNKITCYLNNISILKVVTKAGGRVIAYSCLIRRKGARREHLDYIYKGLMS